MTALYGWLQGDDRGERTAAAHKTVRARVGGWEGTVEVTVRLDGTYEVRVGPHPTSGSMSVQGVEVAHGNVRDWER